MSSKAMKIRISMRSRIGFNFYDVFLYAFCILFGIVCFYPLWYVFIGSISEYADFAKNPLNLLPSWPPTFKYYESILMGQVFQRALGLSLLKTAFGAGLSVLLTGMMAYAVSKKHIKGMTALNFMVVFTMFFSGGLIPTFLLVKGLGMYNTFWALSLPWLMGATNFVIMRNYFVYSVPQELEEAASIDGANAVFIFFRIIVPISMPTIAAVFLFDSVSQWNDWYSFLIYCDDVKLQPVVWLLRRMLIDPSLSRQSADTQTVLQMADKFGYLPPMSLKFTTIIFAMLPIMLVYPFLQRFFVKGILIGAVKG